MSLLQRVTANKLLDREQSIVDNLLYLFSEIIARGPPPEGDLTKGSAATQRFEMKVKTQELIRAAEDLLKLTRELKEYWLMGRLRELNEGEQETEERIAGDASRVVELYEEFQEKLRSQGHVVQSS